jgi:hypothetical protein
MNADSLTIEYGTKHAPIILIDPDNQLTQSLEQIFEGTFNIRRMPDIAAIRKQLQDKACSIIIIEYRPNNDYESFKTLMAQYPIAKGLVLLSAELDEKQINEQIPSNITIIKRPIHIDYLKKTIENLCLLIDIQVNKDQGFQSIASQSESRVALMTRMRKSLTPPIQALNSRVQDLLNGPDTLSKKDLFSLLKPLKQVSNVQNQLRILENAHSDDEHIQKEPCCMEQVINQAKTTLDYQLEDKHITYSLHTDTPFREYASDQYLLEQVARNILQESIALAKELTRIDWEVRCMDIGIEWEIQFETSISNSEINQQTELDMMDASQFGYAVASEFISILNGFMGYKISNNQMNIIVQIPMKPA